MFLVGVHSVIPVDLSTGALGEQIPVSVDHLPEQVGNFKGADFDPLTGNLVAVTGGFAQDSAKLVEIDPETWTVISVSAPLEKGFGRSSSLAFNADGSQLFLGTWDDSVTRRNIYIYNRVPEPTTFLLAILGLSAALTPFRRRHRSRR